MTNGKGHIPRPLSISKKEYDKKFDKIFRKEIVINEKKDKS